MCQSKSAGGARCDTHAKDAIADHQIKYGKLVQQECSDKGIAIDPACFVVTPDEERRIHSKVVLDPAVRTATIEYHRADWNASKLTNDLKNAIEAGDKKQLIALMRPYDTNLRAVYNDSQINKREFAEDMAAAENDQERAAAIAYNNNEIKKLKERKKDLDISLAFAADDALKAYNLRGNASGVADSMSAVRYAHMESKAAQNKLEDAEKKVRERVEKTVSLNKLKKDPGFKAAESSETFRSSEEFARWNSKSKELAQSYKTTSHYLKKAAAKISEDKKAGIDTTKAEATYKELNIIKAKFAHANIIEAHGSFSNEAGAAKRAVAEAREKEYTF